MKNLFTFFLVLTGVYLQAQTLYTKGKDFWIAFPDNVSGSSIELNINANINTSGTVTSGLGLNVPFTVTAGVNTNIVVPNTHIISANQTIENKGIHVVSADSIVLNAASHAVGGGDAVTVLSTPSLGTVYRVTSYHNLNASKALIIATQNATTVTITPSVVTSGGNAAGVPFNIVLNQGQTYSVNATGEMSGTLITASAPINVLGSSPCAQIPTGATFCDMVWETLVPQTYWGTNFVMGHFTGRSNTNYRFRVVAHTNGTAITVNGVPTTTINAGQMYEGAGTGGTWVTTSSPAHVMECAISQSSGGSPGDPFLATVLPTDAYGSNYFFATSSTGSMSSHNITILSPTANTGSVLLDGLSPGAGWVAIGASGWSYLARTLAAGAHTLSSAATVNAMIYGWGGVTSYGYFVGAYKKIVVLPLPIKATGKYDEQHHQNVIKGIDIENQQNLTFISLERLEQAQWQTVQTFAASEMTTVLTDNVIEPKQTYFYRIKILDKDGKVGYSNVVEITTPEKQTWATLYPNPTTSQLTLALTLEQNSLVGFKILSLEGKVLAQQEKMGNVGTQTWDISNVLPKLSAGTYIVQTYTPYKTAYQKFVLLP